MTAAQEPEELVDEWVIVALIRTDKDPYTQWQPAFLKRLTITGDLHLYYRANNGKIYERIHMICPRTITKPAKAPKWAEELELTLWSNNE